MQYTLTSMMYSSTPQDHTSAALALYVLPLVVRMTSGARYAGVPTRDPGALWKFSCCAAHTAGRMNVPGCHSTMAAVP